MCEAYGPTSLTRVLKKPAQLGLDYIGGAQDPEGGVASATSPGRPAILSVTGCAIDGALKTGQMAGSDGAPVGVLKKAEQFLDTCEIDG